MQNADFHLDKDIRINNQRHAGIVIKDDKILLMHRIYKGQEFYVIPGGHIQKGEDPKFAALREIEEETSIKAGNAQLVFEFRNYKKDNYDFYYLCDYISGTPTLGGEEAIKNNPENHYEPMWVELAQVKELNLLPKFAKEWLVETLLK
jgi:8-oxo-dGTP pyrophosphatase MutT (NUDIX family)